MDARLRRQGHARLKGLRDGKLTLRVGAASRTAIGRCVFLRIGNRNQGPKRHIDRAAGARYLRSMVDQAVEVGLYSHSLIISKSFKQPRVHRRAFATLLL